MGAKDQFDPTRYGIFADSEGLASMSEMDLEQGDEYYAMSRNCEGCGQKKQCQIEWSELYCLQYGVDPARVGQAIRRTDLFDSSWIYDARFKVFHPNYRCSCNGNPLVLFNMTPREAERVLHAAGRNGIISDEQQNMIRTIAPVVKQLAGQRSGVPAQQMQQAYRRVPAQGVAPGQHPVGPNGVPIYPQRRR